MLHPLRSVLLQQANNGGTISHLENISVKISKAKFKICRDHASIPLIPEAVANLHTEILAMGTAEAISAEYC
jgi:hypothetical protein